MFEVAEANSIATLTDGVRADRRRWNFEPRCRSLSVMATAPHPTLAELRTSGIVASTEIVAAVTAYVHDPDGGPYCFASGHCLDVAAAVKAHPPSAAVMVEPTAREKDHRLAASIAIMRARPAPVRSGPSKR